MRELFEELGVLQDGVWDERASVSRRRNGCSSRAMAGGNRAGGGDRRDREHYRRFNEKMIEYRASGEFTVPMERGRSEAVGA